MAVTRAKYDKLIGYRARSISAIVNEIAQCGSKERGQSLDLAKNAMKSKTVLNNPELRISVVKLLIALLPETEHMLVSMLQRRLHLVDFELHFSFFCFIDEVQFLELDDAVVERILRAIQDYLIEIKVTTASAAWMAGDLLGDHWEHSSSLPILYCVVDNAKYFAGKDAALYGLYKAYNKTQSKEILDRIKDIAENAKGKKLRFSANILLAKMNDQMKLK